MCWRRYSSVFWKESYEHSVTFFMEQHCQMWSKTWSLHLLSKHTKGSLLFPLANIRVNWTLSRHRWRWWFMATSGWGALVRTVASVTLVLMSSYSLSPEEGPEISLFAQPKNPGTANFFWTEPSPFPSCGEGNGNSCGGPGSSPACSHPQEQLPWSPDNAVGSCLDFY